MSKFMRHWIGEACERAMTMSHPGYGRSLSASSVLRLLSVSKLFWPRPTMNSVLQLLTCFSSPFGWRIFEMQR